VLPVLAHDSWQVEPVIVDLGVGLREYFEVRHHDQIVYCSDRAGLIALLRNNNLQFENFREIEPEDGCE
jgi:hypothetical protein